MKSRLFPFLLWVTMLISSCTDPPELPMEPKIDLKSFGFKQVPNADPNEPISDSLIIELKFEDGDGDLGLVPADSFPPFNELYFYVDDEGDYIKYDPLNTGLPPYNCEDYDIIPVGGNDLDTFYVLRNEFHYNFHLEFYKKVNGTFEKVEFPDCGPGYKGRFFELNTSGRERPLEGVLRFGTASFFRVLFRNDVIKFKVWIYDRNDPAGLNNPEKTPHKSNEVESREFTLSEFVGPV